MLAGDGAQGGDEGGFGGEPDAAVAACRAGLGDGGGDGGVVFSAAEEGVYSDAGGAGEFGQVGGFGQQQEYFAACGRVAAGELFEHGGDGGQGGEVARHQVFGGGFEQAAAFGGGDADGLAGGGLGGEGGGGAVVAVQHEVDGEGALGAVEEAHGVGARDGFFRRPLPYGAAVFKAFGHNRRVLAAVRQQQFEGHARAFAGVVGQLGGGEGDAAGVFADGLGGLDVYQAGAVGVHREVSVVWVRARCGRVCPNPSRPFSDGLSRKGLWQRV